jgi:hydroxyacylglutathione hydrolase
MLFERIDSRGLAHFSYLVGDGAEAVVIDPRRDCDLYVQMAYREGMRISHILETHRNEDYVVGSVELARRTGAEVWHADSQLDYSYGRAAKHGQSWGVGRLEIEAIHTPGHTPGSMSYLLRDPGGAPWVVFTGDTLFAGEVGRVDLLGPERMEEMAGLIHESIFGSLFPLGDQVLVCPAHGAGSVCGESIAERLWTTIGLEKRHNPRLQARDRSEFISNLMQSQPERPPYFREMERLNLEGAPLLGTLHLPRPLPPQEFARLASRSTVLDTRMELGFGAAHVPGAQSIWIDGLASFAGWFLPYESPILLVTETNETEDAARYLLRLGYAPDGYLAGGMLSWHIAGQESASLETLTVQELRRRLDGGESAWMLDVRSEEELRRGGRIPGSKHIHVTQIPMRMNEVPRDRKVYVFCGSGMRSMIAASFLERHGWRNLAVVLGGTSAWRSASSGGSSKNNNK